MRVTHMMLGQSALSALQTNVKRLADIQEQAVTFKRINRPSDDPEGTEKALTLRSRVRSSQARLENLSTTDEWLDANSSALESISSIMTEVQTTALEGANDTLENDERAALAAEINGYLEELMDLSNTRYGDSYIFSGFKTDTQPFELTRDADTDEITGFTYVGDDGKIVRQIESGTETTVNITADDLFSDAINTIITLREALQADDFDAEAVSAMLTDIEDGLDTVSGQLAVVGAKMARVTDATTRLETSQVNLQALLSEVEDADLAEVAVLLSEQQLVYETALEVTGSIMQMSLLDFLD